MITRSAFSFSTTRFSTLATPSGSTLASVFTRMARSAPMASAVRSVSCDLSEPIDTATTSVASPRSLMRTASSTAISSKGFIDILTLAKSTPLPSDLTRTLTLKSTTRFTGTRIFMRQFFPARALVSPQNAPEARYLASAKWPGRYCRHPGKSMVSRVCERLARSSPGRVEQRYAAPPNKQDQPRSGQEPADMRPPSDALFSAEGEVGELGEDPEAKRPIGSNFNGDAPQREHPDLHFRMQDQIGRDDAGDGAAPPDQRQVRGRHDPGMDHRGEDSAHQIEHYETQMAHGVLDIVAEHPEEQHVAKQVNPASVQEHVGDQGEALGHQERRDYRGIAEAMTHELGGNGGGGPPGSRVGRPGPAGVRESIE